MTRQRLTRSSGFWFWKEPPVLLHYDDARRPRPHKRAEPASWWKLILTIYTCIGLVFVLIAGLRYIDDTIGGSVIVALCAIFVVVVTCLLLSHRRDLRVTRSGFRDENRNPCTAQLLCVVVTFLAVYGMVTAAILREDADEHVRAVEPMAWAVSISAFGLAAVAHVTASWARHLALLGVKGQRYREATGAFRLAMVSFVLLGGGGVVVVALMLLSGTDAGGVPVYGLPPGIRGLAKTVIPFVFAAFLAYIPTDGWRQYRAALEYIEEQAQPVSK